MPRSSRRHVGEALHPADQVIPEEPHRPAEEREGLHRRRHTHRRDGVLHGTERIGRGIERLPRSIGAANVSVAVPAMTACGATPIME